MLNVSRYRLSIVGWVLVLTIAPVAGVASASIPGGVATPGAGTAAGSATVDGAASGHAPPSAVGSAGAGGVPESTQSTVRTPEGEPIVVNQTLERSSDPGVLIVTTRIDASRVTDVGSYAGFVVSIPDDATVITTENLSDSAYSGYEFQTDGSTEHAMVRFRVPADQTADCTDDDDIYSSVDEGSWTFTSRYDNGASVVTLYQGTTPPDIDFESNLDVAGTGVGGNGFAYLGPYDEHERTIDGQHVRLVVPNAARSAVNVSRVFGTLAATSSEFDVGKRSDEIVLFTPPDPIRQGGAAVGTWNEGMMDAWVYANSTHEETGNVWIHEYVHVRQAYSYDYSMDGSGTNTSFVVEGGADYAAALLSLYAGNTTFDEFYSQVNTTEGADAILGEQPALGCGGLASYTKGGRVLAALDSKIRNETDGDATFLDLFATLNEDEDGVVTYAEFQDAVEETAGTSFDDWLDTYVKTSAVPPVPNDPFAFALSGADRDGDGLTTSEERDAGTNPFVADTDGDGLADGREVNEFGSDPTARHSDDDGVPDGMEVANGMDPTSMHSDEDGIPDDEEWESDVLDPTATDTDDDGLEDDEEREHGTEPNDPDTDDDGLSDGEELMHETDPTVADSDDDGLSDGEEVAEGTDPLNPDTDGDGLDDGDEIYQYGTDPTESDTDGDGVDDATEIMEDNTDPTDPDDVADDGGDASTDADDGAATTAADAPATTAASDEMTATDDGVVGPSTVPGFSVPAALAALLAVGLLALRGRRAH